MPTKTTVEQTDMIPIHDPIKKQNKKKNFLFSEVIL